MYSGLLTDVGGGKDWAVGFQPPDYFVMGGDKQPSEACLAACTYEWERQLSAEWPLEQESDN